MSGGLADVAIPYVERLPMWRQLMWRGCPCGDSLCGEASHVASAYVERFLAHVASE